MALPRSDNAGADPAVSPRHANLRRLLQPRHVAFIGGDEAAVALRQCLAIGFKGEVWAVNPSRATLAVPPESSKCDPFLRNGPGHLNHPDPVY